MPVPVLITDLNRVAASNYPQGSDTPSTLDDVQRAHASFIALLRDGGGSAFFVPTGTILDFAGSTPPTGFELCDGGTSNRTTDAALFAVIGTTWGAGDGTTTFNRPDLRGRAAIGAGTGSGLTARTLGVQNIGEETHVLTTAELAAHAHTVTISDPSHVHGVNDPQHSHLYANGGTAGGGYATLGNGNAQNSSTLNAATGISIQAAVTGITASAANTGSGTAHNNMPPSAVVNKIIKT